MSRNLILLVIPALVFISSCKKKGNDTPFFMTVKVSTDSSWTTKSVHSEGHSPDMTYIDAINNKTNESISLLISNLEELSNNVVYTIHNPGSGANNAALYSNSTLSIKAESGSITITTITRSSVNGSFTFANGNNKVNGTLSRQGHKLFTLLIA